MMVRQWLMLRNAALVRKNRHTVVDVAVLLANALYDSQAHYKLAPLFQRCGASLFVFLSAPLGFVLFQLSHDLVVVLFGDDDALYHRHCHAMPKLEVDDGLGVVDLQPLADTNRTPERHVDRAFGAHVFGK